MMRAALLTPLLLLAACGGGAATSEDKALDDAAAKLDANSVNVNAAEIVEEDADSAAISNEGHPQ